MSASSFPWTQAFAKAESSIRSTNVSSITPTFKYPTISRVAQLDADLLDEELENMLKEPLWRAIDGVKGSFKRRFEPEMLAALRLAILYSSVYQSGASYGSQLQNLKYVSDKSMLNPVSGVTSRRIAPSKLQKILYISLSVFIPYISTRINDRMLSLRWSDYPLPNSYLSLFNPFNYRRRSSSGEGVRSQKIREWKRAAWQISQFVESFSEVVGLINYLIFLIYGRYRSVLDRTLGMRLDYAHKSFGRGVSFEFLNRQLVWEAVTDFILFLMPLINPRKLRLRFLRLFTALKSFSLSPPTPVSKKTSGPLAFLPPSTCPICFSLSAAPPSSMPQTGSLTADPSDPASAIANLASLATLPNSGMMDSEENKVKIPYAGECGCKYCYYCLVPALVRWEAEGKAGGWECLRCGQEIKEVKKWDEQQEERKKAAEEEEKRNLRRRIGAQRTTIKST